MSSLVEIREQSAFRLQIDFMGETGALSAPQSARYRIDCETNRTQIQDWQPIAPLSESPSISILPSQNEILDDRNLYEMRVVTIQADPGESTQYTDRYRYLVKNLAGIQ